MIELPSFDCLDSATRMLLFEESPFAPFLRPVFNAYRFPVHYTQDPGLDPIAKDTALRDLFDHRAELELDDCHHYNQHLLKHGFIDRTFLSLRGVCSKSKDTCKNFKKWSCGGCGRTFLPGSLNDPACTVGQYPWWYLYIQSEIEDTIREHGGVSKTDPLIFFPTGAKRHGRTTTFDPTKDS